jgi:hypothetical protein
VSDFEVFDESKELRMEPDADEHLLAEMEHTGMDGMPVAPGDPSSAGRRNRRPPDSPASSGGRSSLARARQPRARPAARSQRLMVTTAIATATARKRYSRCKPQGDRAAPNCVSVGETPVVV